MPKFKQSLVRFPGKSSSPKSNHPVLIVFQWPGNLIWMLGFLFLACSESKQKPSKEDSAGAKANTVDRTSSASDAIRALSLDRYRATVPPLVVSEWLKGHFPLYVPAQGKAPEHWSPIEKDIQPEACGTCHQQQYKDWKESLHHKGMGPGVLGQLLDMELDEPLLAITCQRCHAPMEEQIPYLQKGVKNPLFVKGLREKGLTCAGCHVRSHVRHGPPARLPGSEKRGPHSGFVVKAEYENPAFCASCHDFEGAGSMHGKLIQETAQEWRRTEFAAQGKTCQSCHMPDRRHLWKGIHDPEMVRSAVSIQTEYDPGTTGSDSVLATLTLTNVGAGHRLPTYIEPQIVLSLEQIDSIGIPIPGSQKVGIIARKFTEDMETEIFDTRLMPGEFFKLRYAAEKALRAKELRARVEVWPDEAYRLYFIKMLATPALRPEMKEVVNNIETAIEMNTKSRYLLWQKSISL